MSTNVDNNQRRNDHAFLLMGDSVVYCDPFVLRALQKDGIPSETMLEETDACAYALRKVQLLKEHVTPLIHPDQFIRMDAVSVERQLANLAQVTFEVTDACNLKCKYCGYGEFYDDYDERHNAMLDVRKAELLLRFLSDKWNSPLNVSHDQRIALSFYGGEPLLNMDFIKSLIRYAEEDITLLHNHFIFNMTTNGMLLHKYLPYLVAHDVHLLISMDGDREGHSYRVNHSGENSFDQVYANVRKIQQEYPKYFETNVAFNSVLHNRNSVAGIYQFIKEEFGKIPAIAELNNTGIKPEKKEDFFQAYRNVHESLHQAENYERINDDMFVKLGENQELGLFLFKHSGNFFQSYNDFFVSADTAKRTPTGTCAPFGKKMFLTVNGKILPCERVGHQHMLGLVDLSGVHLDCENIAEKYNHYYEKLSRQCTRCYNADACKQCFFQLDDLDEEKPVCYGYTTKSDFYSGIMDKMNYLSTQRGLYGRFINELIIQD